MVMALHSLKAGTTAGFKIMDHGYKVILFKYFEGTDSNNGNNCGI